MTIFVATDDCKGCGECLEICPADAFVEVSAP